ncbi:MAG: hypothetical protein HQL56_16820 [Magnetococcales bacterium]|nr:hypothetical protein [Magnetococcales bacterium]
MSPSPRETRHSSQGGASRGKGPQGPQPQIRYQPPEVEPHTPPPSASDAPVRPLRGPLKPGRDYDKVSLSTWINGITWLLLILVLGLIESASPQVETFFSRIFKVSVRKEWDMGFIQYAIALALLAFAVPFASAVHNILKTGKVSTSDAVSLGTSLVSLIAASVLLFSF